MEYPEHAEAAARPARGFARPYDLELDRQEGVGGFWATLRHVIPAGALVRLELEDGAAHVVQVEATRKQYDALRPAAGERLYVKPRQVRIFVESA
jgi:sulfate transport system ATP-binding protein